MVDVDDGWSLLGLLNSPRCDLIGVSSTFGNDYEEYTYQSLSKLLSFPHPQNATQDIPLYHGAKKPMPSYDGPPSFQDPKSFVIKPNDAVRALHKQLVSMPDNERLYIYADGPVTNIGMLIELFPEVISKIAFVAVFMGRITIDDPKLQAGSKMVKEHAYFTVLLCFLFGFLLHFLYSLFSYACTVFVFLACFCFFVVSCCCDF